MVKSAVKVCVRTKPTTNFAQGSLDIHDEEKTIKVFVQKRTDANYIDNQREHFIFKFDSVMNNVPQENIHEECAKDIVVSCVEGYNGTIMAYGQTGAGKTYTMSGGTNYKQRGLIARCIEQIFKEIQSRPENMYTVKVSFLEIYNETLVDLLSDFDNIDGVEGDIQIMEDSKGHIFVRGLKQIVVSDQEAAFGLMFQGEMNRSICEHQLNKSSTRSHCVFSIYLESRSMIESDSQVVYSKLNLVDLAGSERVGKTNSTGSVLKEAMYINKSLTFLEQVVVALSSPSRDHIPYRQSKLTHYLKDSLGGNCKTVMIANVWCETAHLEETISTLKFATRMMRVSNDAIVNVQTSPEAMMKKYEQQIKQLKQELAMHDQLKGVSQVTYDPYSEDQKLELRKHIRKYIDGEIEEIEIKSLRQIKETFVQFKAVAKQMESEISNLKSKINEEGDGSNQINNSKPSEREVQEGVGIASDSSGFGVGKAFAPSDKFSRSKKNGKKSQNKLEEKKEEKKEEKEEVKENAEQKEEKIEKPKMNRAEAYELYKIEDGAEMWKVLKENMATLAEHKKSLKDVSIKLNEQKKEIDHFKEIIEKTKSEIVEDAEPSKGTSDEEEKMYESMKEAKQRYRTIHEERSRIKTEIDYTSKMVDNTREKLVSQFCEWYGAKFEDNTPERDENNETQWSTTNGPSDNGNKEDVEKTQQLDPEASAFYKAQKRSEKFAKNKKQRSKIK